MVIGWGPGDEVVTRPYVPIVAGSAIERNQDGERRPRAPIVPSYSPRDAEPGYNGGSVACSSRTVMSAASGGGNPTDVRLSTKLALDQRARK